MNTHAYRLVYSAYQILVNTNQYDTINYVLAPNYWLVIDSVTYKLIEIALDDII